MGMEHAYTYAAAALIDQVDRALSAMLTVFALAGLAGLVGQLVGCPSVHVLGVCDSLAGGLVVCARVRAWLVVVSTLLLRVV